MNAALGNALTHLDVAVVVDTCCGQKWKVHLVVDMMLKGRGNHDID